MLGIQLEMGHWAEQNIVITKNWRMCVAEGRLLSVYVCMCLTRVHQLPQLINQSFITQR